MKGSIAVFAVVSLLAAASWAADPAPKATPKIMPDKEDPVALEKTILDAPGPVGCYTNMTGQRLESCEQREKGIAAFRKLYDADATRAIAVIQKRFDEIPSPKGGYFPILAAVQVKDKAFVPMLKKLADSQKENDLGLYAAEAARMIETGKCSQVPAPAKLRELCM